MSSVPIFPPSFPNREEKIFLDLLLGDDEHFLSRWQTWKEGVVFDDVDFATLRLLSLLYMRLRDAGIAHDTYIGRIRGVYRMVWARNQRLLKEISDISNVCRTHGVEVLLLKGLALLLRVYRDPAARFLGDGDILVKKKDVVKVCSILEERGWTCTDPSVTSLNKMNYDGLFEVTHALTFRKGVGLEIEVHWHVFHVELERALFRLLTLRGPRRIADESAYWQYARSVDLYDASVKMLSYEDMLVHVIVHGAEGNASHRTLRWVVDAVHLIRSVPIDWDRVLERTRAGGHMVAMQYGITYLNDCAYVPIPHSFVDTLMQLPNSRRERIDYQKRTHIWYPPLGNFPILWYRYWKFESQGSFVHRVRLFLPFLKKAWSIPAHEHLLTFVFKKYSGRAARMFGSK